MFVDEPNIYEFIRLCDYWYGNPNSPFDKKTIENDFKKRVEKHFNFENFPLRVKEKIHSLSYASGHSSGFYEIFNCLDDYVDLAREAIKLGGGIYSSRGE